MIWSFHHEELLFLLYKLRYYNWLVSLQLHSLGFHLRYTVYIAISGTERGDAFVNGCRGLIAITVYGNLLTRSLC
jgi:hypothetical protein